MTRHAPLFITTQQRLRIHSVQFLQHPHHRAFNLFQHPTTLPLCRYRASPQIPYMNPFDHKNHPDHGPDGLQIHRGQDIQTLAGIHEERPNMMLILAGTEISMQLDTIYRAPRRTPPRTRPTYTNDIGCRQVKPRCRHVLYGIPHVGNK